MAETVVGALREPLSSEQTKLISTIYEPYGLSGEWPIWQYVDISLDALGLDAAAVLSSLPSVRSSDAAMWASSYALTWYMNRSEVPQPNQQIALTIAGLRYVKGAEPLLGAFLTALEHLVAEQRNLVPSPTTLVEATVTSDSIGQLLLTASIEGQSAPPVERTLHKLRQLFEHEPMLHIGVQRPDPNSARWTMRVPATLRELRTVTTIDEYLDRIIRWVAPPNTPSMPSSPNALDIPYAVGYLDAVWKSRTGNHLFASLDPASVARLTQSCTTEADFNSLLSALADVLGQVVTPGRTSPPQRGALEAFRDQVSHLLETDAAERVRAAIDVLIGIRHLRVSTQHGDARHRAVKAFGALGLSFPPLSWEHAWVQVALLARGSLDVLREEVNVSVSDG
jgi:hypothetical protein